MRIINMGQNQPIKTPIQNEDLKPRCGTTKINVRGNADKTTKRNLSATSIEIKGRRISHTYQCFPSSITFRQWYFFSVVNGSKTTRIRKQQTTKAKPIASHVLIYDTNENEHVPMYFNGFCVGFTDITRINIMILTVG